MSNAPEQPPDAAAKGGLPSSEDLLARNLPALVAYLRARVGNALAARESVHDLAQSVCREVLADVDELVFRSEEAFRAYLFLQASRKVIDRARFHRMAMRDPARETELPQEHESQDLLRGFAMLFTPSRQAAAKEELSRVEDAIRDLPENQREAVLLSRIGGISYVEIARQMGLTESAVRGLVARGLARLAAKLGTK
ncbi:MAG: sigma-70 family RNA polymerase sigma factor [Planctomycetota bacterium]